MGFSRARYDFDHLTACRDLLSPAIDAKSDEEEESDEERSILL
jgi:hypothetical protein